MILSTAAALILVLCGVTAIGQVLDGMDSSSGYVKPSVLSSPVRPTQGKSGVLMEAGDGVLDFQINSVMAIRVLKIEIAAKYSENLYRVKWPSVAK